MNRKLLAVFAATLLVGCLKTRAELEAEQTGQAQEKVTVAQQQAARKETPSKETPSKETPSKESFSKEAAVKEKAPPTAYRFEEIDEQMRQLNGRVETVENQLAQLNNAKGGDKEGAAKDKQVLEQKFVAYEDALRKMETQLAALSEEVAHLRAPPPEPVAPLAGKSDRAVYDLAEKHFSVKKYKEAITGFQKYREQSPRGKNFADATYKIGVCFQELGMKEEAKAFLEEVTAKFPNSKEAKKAAFRMKSLK